MSLKRDYFQGWIVQLDAPIPPFGRFRDRPNGRLRQNQYHKKPATVTWHGVGLLLWLGASLVSFGLASASKGSVQSKGLTPTPAFPG